MPGDLELALRVRADMQEALQGIGALNRSLGETARRGDEAGSALSGAAGSTQTFAVALGSLGRESESTPRPGQDRGPRAPSAPWSPRSRASSPPARPRSPASVDSVIADLTRIATRRFHHPAARQCPIWRVRRGEHSWCRPVRPLAGRGRPPRRLGRRLGRRLARRAAGHLRRRRALSHRGHRRAQARRGADHRATRRGHLAACLRRDRPARGSLGRDQLREPRARRSARVSREVRLDPRGMIVTVVTEDIDTGGPASQAIARRFGLRKRGGMSAGGLVWPDYVAVEADGYGVADDPNVARTPLRRWLRPPGAALRIRAHGAAPHRADRGRRRLCALPRMGRRLRTPLVRLDRARDRQPCIEPACGGGAGGIEYTAHVGGDGRRSWDAHAHLERASDCDAGSEHEATGPQARPARTAPRAKRVAKRAERAPGD